MNEAEFVLTDILRCDRAALYVERSRLLGKGESARLSQVFRRRVRGEPVQYILGKTEFMGRVFRVDRSVLIPRPETELLVETAARHGRAAAYRRFAPGRAVLDLGTGSGCIIISLGCLLPGSRLYASDISACALALAAENAAAHAARVTFYAGDLFAATGLAVRKYDLIVSNPPYVRSAEIKTLSRRGACRAARQSRRGQGWTAVLPPDRRRRSRAS